MTLGVRKDGKVVSRTEEEDKENDEKAEGSESIVVESERQINFPSLSHPYIGSKILSFMRMR